jgi:hypothetical protein
MPRKKVNKAKENEVLDNVLSSTSSTSTPPIDTDLNLQTKMNPMRALFVSFKAKAQSWYDSVVKDIPKEYNQVPLLKEIGNETIDLYVSITTRGDGKTTSYIHALARLAIDHGIKTAWFGRHYTVRNSYAKTIIEAFDVHPFLKSKDLVFKRYDFYLEVYYGNIPIFLISDLEHATDLKYESTTLKQYQIFAYDEFLALDRDYLPDEDDLFYTIVESMTRGDNMPKVLLLGNPVNFESPLLAEFDLFTILERHKINTVKQYDNVLMEIKHNEVQQAKRKNNLFKKRNEVDPMTRGEFNFKQYLLSKDISKSRYPFKMIIKYDSKYVEVMSDFEGTDMNIKVSAYADYFDYCTSLNDLDSGITLLNYRKHTNEHFYKRFEDKTVKFYDAFSLSWVDKNPRFQELNLVKLMAIKFEKPEYRDADGKLKDGLSYTESAFEVTMRNLFSKFEF